MPIKKSYLEQKWYYRVAKVFFYLVPLLFAVIKYLRLRDSFFLALAENIVLVFVGLVAYALVINIIWRVLLYLIYGGLENDTKPKAAVAAAPAATPVKGSNKWVGSFIFSIIIIFVIFYLATGDFDSSGIKSSSHTYGTACTTSAGKTGLYGTNGSCFTCSAGSSAVTNPRNNCSDGIAGVWCCSNSTTNTSGSSGSKCIPTGCGSRWHCFGTYYVDGRQVSVNGCYDRSLSGVYSSWSGTCRQCP